MNLEERNQSKDTVTFSVLENADRLMQLYSGFESNAKFVVDRIWANVKFFTTIASALLTISIGLYGSENIQKAINIDPNLKSLVFAIIPIIVIMISVIGMKNLKREYMRFLEWIVVIQKTQETLGLHNKMYTKIFAEDKYLLPERIISSKHNNSDDFIESGLKKKNSLYYYFNILHRAYVVISIIIATLILLGPLKDCVKEILRICS